jgi:hypothetical protein
MASADRTADELVPTASAASVDLKSKFEAEGGKNISAKRRRNAEIQSGYRFSN